MARRITPRCGLSAAPARDATEIRPFRGADLRGRRPTGAASEGHELYVLRRHGAAQKAV
jgi:hypothetical protein